MSKKNSKGVCKTFKDYAESSSIHGVAYISTPTSTTIDRIFWTIFICLGLATAVMLSKTAYEEWQDNPVLTTLKKTSKKISSNQFPSVTICTEGVNMEAVRNALVKDIMNWRNNSGSNRDIVEDVKLYLNTTFGLNLDGLISLDDIVKSYSTPNLDMSVGLGAVANDIAVCANQDQTFRRKKRKKREG